MSAFFATCWQVAKRYRNISVAVVLNGRKVRLRHHARTCAERGARFFSFIEETWWARISYGPSKVGDLAKCRANCETWSKSESCVGCERLRTCISSIMRNRSEVIAKSLGNPWKEGHCARAATPSCPQPALLKWDESNPRAGGAGTEALAA